MAKDHKDEPVVEGDVIAPHEEVTDETVHPAVPRLRGDSPQVVDPHPTTTWDDPAIDEQLVRIADLERELEEEKRNQRRRLADAEKVQLKSNLDNREADLRAQLARVRGEEVPQEPHEE